MCYDNKRTSDFICTFDSSFGEGAFKLLGLYEKLDSFDKGRVIGGIEEMLKNSKYSQKDNNGGE
ncbi:MAG: hypothetical protein NC299_16745 [Lachnospiraceae bacterium]|nr:hypothetical protein [Lachnospiraceae bacterium]